MSGHTKRRVPSSTRHEPKLFALALPAALTIFGAPAAADTIGPEVSCPSLLSLSIPNTQILNATPKPADATGPARCTVIGVINKRVSQQDPNHFTYGIAFSLNLPDAWTGRFEMMGNAGTAGTLNGDPVGSGGAELQRGWAVAANDGGHENAPAPPPFGSPPPPGITWVDEDPNAGGSAHFGVDEQAREDYGYNAFLQSSLVSQLIIKRYYGHEPDYSYFWGCSDGGREAMMASQRFPSLFDGIIAANPGFNLPQAAIAEAWNEQALAPLATTLDGNGQPNVATTFPPQDLAVASAAILSACDALDGLVDGIVDNYAACNNKVVYPALDAYTCSPTGAHGNSPHAGFCLTAAQVAALKKIYAGPVNSHGKPLYGSWFWDAGIWDPPASGFALGWAAWNVAFLGNPAFNTAINLTLGAGALPMIFTTPPTVTPVNGPNGQEAFMFRFNFDTQAPLIFNKTREYPQSAMEFMAAVSTDLGRFRRTGGKMIIYNALNDGIFSSAPLVDWYEQMNRQSGHRAADFARLFLVPNMAHCGGGPATVPIANGQPGALLESITNWVEHGVAPDKIIGRYSASPTSPFSGPLFDPQVATNFPAGPTGGTRPLCPFPQQTRYKGAGATNDAANFICAAPPRHRDGHDKDDD
jgi:feruloyl esterase